MSDENKPETQIIEKPPVFGVPSYRTDQYRAVYSNVCQVSISQPDVQILFARGGNVLGDSLVEEVATVYLSPIQAKALLMVLAQQIQAYEQKYGEISLKENLAAKKPEGKALQ